MMSIIPQRPAFARARRRSLVLLVILGVCILAALSAQSGLGQSIPERAISCVHLTLSDDPTVVNVTWRSNQVTEDCVVKAWPAQLGEMPADEAQVVTAQAVQHSYKFARETVNIYDATLKGLRPDTVYNYVVNCAGESSPVYQLQTAITDVEAGYTFVVMGDCRGNYGLFGKFMRMAREAGARFVLFTGDMTDGATQAEWNMWFEAAADTLPYLPFMPVFGNHERGAPRTYFEQFVLPGTEKSYSFDYGMAHFAVVYDVTNAELEEEVPWLAKDLAGSDAVWKFLALHRPFYASSPEWDESQSPKDILLPVVENNGVSMVFSGHVHLYERSVPMLGGKPAKGGIVYQVTGGAGAPLYALGTSETTAKTIRTEHMIIYKITPRVLSATVVDSNGSILDEYTVTPRK